MRWSDYCPKNNLTQRKKKTESLQGGDIGPSYDNFQACVFDLVILILTLHINTTIKLR